MPEVGKQRGEEQAHGVVQLFGEEIAAEAEGEKRHDTEVDHLGQQLRLAVAAFQHLGQLQADHHRVHHQESQRHFLTLKKLVKEDLAEQQLAIAHCFLEPTFYSEMYGLQGRIDIFHQSNDKNAIIELKSGKPFQPNVYGISPNHFVQTLLYDLLVQSTFGKDTDPVNYILYSSQQETPLRFAPRVKAQQYDALQVRNHLVALEWLFLQIGQTLQPPFKSHFQACTSIIESFPHFQKASLPTVAF